MVYINNVDITEAQSLCLLPRCTVRLWYHL